MASARITAHAIPIPMPAFAPVERPELARTSGTELEVGVELEVAVRSEVDVADGRLVELGVDSEFSDVVDVADVVVVLPASANNDKSLL